MREQQALISFMDKCEGTSAGMIVVTLFHAEGSTYQKPGTRLLVSPEGDYCGLISGGCLEPEIILRAKGAWQENNITAWTIDTRDDADAWLGYGVGCKGLLRLVFEPILFHEIEQLTLLKALIRQAPHIKKVVHTYCDTTKRLGRAVQTQQGWQLSSYYPPYENDDPTCVTDNTLVFTEIMPRPWALTIFTGNKDAEPLAALCDTLHWPYHVIVRHPNQLAEPWPNALSITLFNRANPIKTLQTHCDNYVVVMTHNVELDYAILASLAQQPHVTYIGLLGPEHRKEAILSAISTQAPESATALTHKLYAPIGLPLGGRLPTEIALSIISQIQAKRYEKPLPPQRQLYTQKKSRPQRHQKISVVILAAGGSKRLGFPKQLIEFHGKTLLQHAIEKSRAVANHGIYVVLGGYFEKISATLQGPETILYNADWESGLASAIQIGFRAAIPNPAQSPEQSVLFVLVDQPLVSTKHLQALIQQGQTQQTHVVASQYSDTNTLGVPALFASNQAPAIECLSGNAGCKTIIHAAKSCCTVPSDALDFDIDYPTDLQRLAQITQPTTLNPTNEKET